MRISLNKKKSVDREGGLKKVVATGRVQRLRLQKKLDFLKLTTFILHWVWFFLFIYFFLYIKHRKWLFVIMNNEPNENMKRNIYFALNKKVVFSDNKRNRSQISRHERLKKHDIYYMITINKLSQYTKNIPKKKNEYT